ncbi:hypothetical protein MMC21_001624 [Puttea exsequens]|nr:hypothetical protein [Puttea exsequens]
MQITDTSMVRYLTASARTSDKTLRGYSKASTLDELTAKTLSCMWNLVSEGRGFVLTGHDTQMNRPAIHESLFDQSPFFKPFVSVHCRSYRVTEQQMEFPHDQYAHSSLDASGKDPWKVPDAAWNTSTNVANGTKFSWFDILVEPDSPSIAAVSVVTLPVSDRPHIPDMNQSHRRVVPCTVDAWWVPVRIWIDPKNDNSIHDDLGDIVTSDFATKQDNLLGAHKIVIDQSWADALNVKPIGSNETVIEALMTPRLTPLGPRPNVEDTISYLLGLHIVEGIARVHSATRGWHFPLRKFRAPPIVGPNATCALLMCHPSRLSCGPGLEEAAKEDLTRITFSTIRYGYGWGLKGAAVKLANVALLLHAALCLSYAGSCLWRGRTFSIASSIGEMIALAMNSAPTEKLKNTCVGIMSLATWKKVVVVRETRNDHLELVFEDGSDDDEIGKVPQAGKKY